MAAKLDAKALYHRTLDDRFAKVPYLHYEVRTSAFESAASKTGITLGTAYTIRERKLVKVLYVLKKDQEFRSYATPWEIGHSRLSFGWGSGNAAPLVDDNMTVVGHVGWFKPETVFFPQREVQVTRKKVVMVRGQPRSLLGVLTDVNPVKSLEEDRKRTAPKPYVVDVGRTPEEMLEDGVEIRADRYNDHYLKQGFVQQLPLQTLSQCVTDCEGRVLFFADSRDKQALEPSWVTPYDLFSVVKLVGVASAAVVGMIGIRMLARSAASRTLRGVMRELAKDGADDAAGAATREGTGAATREGASATGGAGGAAGQQAGRTTARGIGAVAAQTRRRVGPVTIEEMRAYLMEILAARPDLRRLMSARALSGTGRLDAIKAALREFETTTNWKVVEKTAAQMEAVTARDNIVTLRAQIREVWINKDRAARWDADEFYEHVVHDLSAHALVGRGGTFGAKDLVFVGEEFTSINNALFVLENAIMQGNLERVLAILVR